MKQTQQNCQTGQTIIFNYISLNLTVEALNDNQCFNIGSDFTYLYNANLLQLVYLVVNVVVSAMSQ